MRFNFRSSLFFFPLVALLCSATVVFSQDNADTAVPEEKTEAPPDISVLDISAQIRETIARMRQMRERMAPDPAIETLRESIPEIEDELEANRARSQRLRTITRNTLGDLRERWLRLNQWTEDGQTLLSFRLADVGQLHEETIAGQSQWQAALTRAREVQAPDAVIERINEILRSEKDLGDELRARIQNLLTLQDQLTGFSLIVSEYLEKIQSAETRLQLRLLSRDNAPLWALGEDEEGAPILREELADSWSDVRHVTQQFAVANKNRLVWHVLLFGTLLWFALQMRKDIPKDLSDQPGWLATRPFSLALLISLLFTLWLYPVIPSHVGVLISVVAIIAMVRLVPVLAGPKVWPALALITIVMSLHEFRHLVPFGLQERVLLLIQTLLTVASLMVIRRTYGEVLLSRRFGIWAIRLIDFSIGSAVVAILGNIAGYVNLSRMITGTIASSGFIAVAVYLAVTFLQRVVDYVASKREQYPLRLVHEHSGRLVSFTKTLISVGGVFVWLAYTLEVVGLRRKMQDTWHAISDHQIQLGSIEFSLGQVLAFVITLVVAILFARLIRMILERELFARIHLPRGMPNTISTMVGYTIVGLGFLVAVSAAGMDLTNFGIIIGALGVGIGFGLQNIVNNFMSGMILIFERPVQVGDTVQLGDMWGNVSSIGIRASTLKTFDGADVIVPNGDLISNQVTNWTRSDQRRRQKLPVKVAFGSDPRQVIAILTRVAEEHEATLKNPAPMALFDGTSETGMNFFLMWWTPFEVGLGARNQVAIATHEALRDASIAAPIPVRRVTNQPPETR